MAYDEKLADRVREYLYEVGQTKVEEKRMFGGLAFLINEKMCVNVSGSRLMCRFDPEKLEEVAEINGFQSMVMKGRVYKGYCYVGAEAIQTRRDLAYWIDLCLDFNDKAKSSK
ncbi:TfoX/Sxy family protein [Cyclobacterium sp. 1_MG-2023]|uniref:TfoX/Sxy family protein n=1 Tax=Cyclobacterium TaxID=68288 RepID=UPI0026E1EB60|nr:TfoX/Sxy family protein [Cyclobacterium sp. 1_MG-2023]MBR9775309.1 TfoX/Sxy family protein [Cytophagales bacterium]MDO6438880.1 TfoX/Sxy family protein [Cyclobacterium sp. 1_MG-2023]|tara:strand:- start:35420 stop:35758 length:339 start_codon:yes stop_codon:yes gene_type:complete